MIMRHQKELEDFEEVNKSKRKYNNFATSIMTKIKPSTFVKESPELLNLRTKQ